MDLHAIARYIRAAETEDLLDRVTVYRDDMEPAALDLMEQELARRGHHQDAIAEHSRQRLQKVLRHADGRCRRCSFCDRPAVLRRWGWHRLWGRWPVIRRPLYYCGHHAPIRII